VALLFGEAATREIACGISFECDVIRLAAD